jgi:hypothetical protein
LLACRPGQLLKYFGLHFDLIFWYHVFILSAGTRVMPLFSRQMLVSWLVGSFGSLVGWLVPWFVGLLVGCGNFLLRDFEPYGIFMILCLRQISRHS